jgi:hypothetical protein
MLTGGRCRTGRQISAPEFILASGKPWPDALRTLIDIALYGIVGQSHHIPDGGVDGAK